MSATKKDGLDYPKEISLDPRWRTRNDRPDIMETDNEYLCNE